MKKILLDIIFIVIAAATLVALNQYGLFEKYIGFALIPILIAYYLGQYVAKKHHS
ncbi:hypothetical protein [Labilibacter marinus]|uniref:hypothetical protein n=1 Tax=Labilibacter marinus TaxID=1477105 RepID=UPI001300F6A7|nr:hypothetical protein [Labilibacter marinus]